ncbi:MAG: GtrA family protein [Candidatus Zambryskibacteria bacterium]|nr:GtrA family protein [Candidatus Zambryskibacteria bacterium]
MERLKRLFVDKKFVHYTWISIFISILNIFLIWLLIDIIGIPTLISTTVVIGSTFIIRYIIFDFFKIL